MKEELNEKKVNPIDTIARREEEQTNEHQDMLVNHSDKADELMHTAEIETDSDWIKRSFTDRHTAHEADMEEVSHEWDKLRLGDLHRCR